MDQWKLWLVYLLPLCLCSDHEVTLVRTTGRDPYDAPLCSVGSLRENPYIVCRISRKRRKGENCFLAYKYGKDFVPECDSRFTIRTVDQTAYLHLTSLTPADSGNYSCRCPFPRGTNILHLHITVEEPSSHSRIVLITASVIGIIVAGVVIGCILRKRHCRDDTRSETSELPVCETPFSLDQADPDDPYASLQQPAGDLYQTISSVHRQHDNQRNSASSNIETAHLDNQGIDGTQMNPSCEIYENISIKHQDSTTV